MNSSLLVERVRTDPQPVLEVGEGDLKALSVCPAGAHLDAPARGSVGKA